MKDKTKSLYIYIYVALGKFYKILKRYRIAKAGKITLKAN